MGSNGKRPRGPDRCVPARRMRTASLLALLLAGVPFASTRAQQLLAEKATAKSRPIPLSGQWEVKGNFRQVRVDPSAVHADERRLLYWLAVPKAGPEGVLATPAFAAPRILAFLVTGEVGSADSQVWVERLPDGQRLHVHTNSGQFWRRVAWELPPPWQGRTIRIVAMDRGLDASCRLGVSSPYTLDAERVARAHWISLKIVPQTLLGLVLFLSPGLLMVLVLRGHRQLPASILVMSAATLSCLVGYGIFWVYFFSAWVGQGVGTALDLAAAAGLVLGLLCSGRLRQQIGSADVAAPLSFWMATALLYQGLVFSADLGMPDYLTHDDRFMDATFEVDDQLPLILALKMYEGPAPKFFFGGWHTSDRPPLQSGLVLQQLPVARALGLALPLYYQLLGCVLQCCWVPALWALCRTISSSRGRVAAVMLCVIFSGFALLESTYVWPKMLAAALVLFAFVVLLQALLQARCLSWAEAIEVGIGVALGPLAHGSAAFACLALGMLAAYFGSTLGWRRLIVSLAVTVGLTLPWLAYQRYYDPPGDRLAKWHLAGAIEPDDRSLSQALADNYAQIGIAGALSNKLANVRTLFMENSKELFGVYPTWCQGAEPIFVTWRRRQHHQIAWALGVLNVGWVVPLAALFLRQRLPRAERLTLLFALLSLIVWIVLMFGPGTTVIHQGSYATFLLLFALLALGVVALPRLLAVLLVTLHIGWFFTVWIFTSPANSYALPNAIMIVWSLMLAGGIGALAWRSAREPAVAHEAPSASRHEGPA